MLLCKQEQEIRKIGAMFVEGTLEGFNLPVCPDFKDGVTVELEPGTSGGSKMWLGKDYSNPINRDFFDVHKPYEGTPEGFFRAFCVLIGSRSTCKVVWPMKRHMLCYGIICC